MEVADDRDRGAQAPDLADDLRNRGRGSVGIDGDPDQFRAGMRQPRDLDRRGVGIGRVRVGHRLDDDRAAATDHDTTYVNGRGPAP